MTQNKYKKKKILVTGGTGFLGRYFVRLLIQVGYLPILLVRPGKELTAVERVKEQFSEEEIKSLTIWEGELTDLTSNDIPIEWRKNGPIDAMFHIAGLVKFDKQLKDLLHKVNVQGTRNALSLAQGLSISRFFYISTAYTAGTKEHASETLHATNNSFHNAYEESKCLAEHLVMNENKPLFKATILRPSIIIGDSKTGEADTQFSIYGFLRGLSLFKRRVEKHLKFDKGQAYFPLQIEGDPRGLSNLVPVNYVAEVMVTALETECEHDIYHLTNPFAPTKQLLLEVFSELLQVKGMSMVKYLEKRTDWDERFSQFISVYQPYMQNDPAFLTDHTYQLLTKAKKKILHLQKEDYLRIFRPVLYSEELPELIEV
jgi:nucleoside-diphosphate-sugar epimerase